MLSLLASALSPLSPPLPTALEPLPSSDSDHHHSSSTSLIIIAAILVFVFVVSATIHFLLHFLSRSSTSSFSFSFSSYSSASSSPSDQDRSNLIDSLPPLSLAAGALESSLDCAVCLSRLCSDDNLRLLPACHHAFHSPCIASWLRSNPSCPLCRSAILLPPPPPPIPPPPPPPPQPSIASATVVHRDDFPAPAPLLPARPSCVRPSVEQPPEGAKEAAVAPAGAKTAESAGAAGRGWLKEYVDRVASSASSSFSSLRFSSMGSRRFGGDGNSWDLEGFAETSGTGGGRSDSSRWSERS